jgi:hypothetical protein
LTVPLHEHLRHVGHVPRGSIDVIVVEHGDDLVVRFAAVHHLEPADDPGADEDLGTGDRPLAV